MNDNYWGKLISKRKLGRRGALGLAGTGLAGAMLLAACGGDDDSSTGSSNGDTQTNQTKEGEYTASSGTPVQGGRFRTINITTPNFNVFTNWQEGNNLGGLYVYDRPLTPREDERQYVLEAMESIELRDPLTLVMKLRPGMTYTNTAPVNGRAVDAEDIVASQAYVKETPKSFDKTFVNSYLERVEAADKQTVVYHLKQPAAYLFSGLLLGSSTGQPIVPRETLGPSLDTAVQVGSGPFMVSDQRADVTYLYKQNPGFWGRKLSQPLPYVSEVEVRILDDRAAQEAAFYGGQVDEWGKSGPPTPSPAQMRTAKQQLRDGQFFYERPGFFGTNLSTNMWPERDLPWRDVRVREAIWRLVNRQDLLTRGLEGAGEVPPGLLPTTLKPYQVDSKDVEQYLKNDVQKAKQLLSAANWDETKRWQILTRGGGDVLESVALVVQSHLAQGGITTDINASSGGSAFLDALTNKTWHFMLETPPGTDKPGQQLRTQHSDCWSDLYRGFGLFDKEVDALIEKSEQTIDFEQNRKQVLDIQKLCMSKFSSSWPVLTQFELRILSARLQNYELTAVPNARRHQMWVKA